MSVHAFLPSDAPPFLAGAAAGLDTSLVLLLAVLALAAALAILPR